MGCGHGYDFVVGSWNAPLVVLDVFAYMPFSMLLGSGGEWPHSLSLR